MSSLKRIGFQFIVLLVLIATVTACKTDILQDDGETTANAKNIRVRVFAYVNNAFYNPDSLYFLGGANLKIDDIELVHSNFYFVDQGDTLPEGDPASWKLSSGEPSVFLYQLTPGSYSGFYRYVIGIDSITNLLPPQNQPSGSPFKDESLYRGTGKGYNYVTITGRIQDPNKPGSEPDIPMKWVLATTALNTQFGLGKSFNLAAGRPVTFDAILRIEELFTGLAPLATPLIESDPSNANDIQAAQQLRTNLEQAYQIQL